MSRKEIVSKIKKNDLVAKTNIQKFENSLNDTHLKDFQNSHIKNLYKNEMDIIFEGFNNI